MANSPLQKLFEIRSAIERARIEMETVRRADLPHEETRARLTQAAKGVLNEFPGVRLTDFSSPNPAVGRLSAFENVTRGELIWLLGVGPFVEGVMAHIEAEGRPVGLPMVERLKRVEELRSDIKRLEREEELEVCTLEDAGHPVYRRGDADLEILLDVWSEKNFRPPAPAAARVRARETA